MKRKIAITALSVILAGAPAYAIFGIGLPVFDASAFAEMIEQVSWLSQQYNQLVKTYKTITNQYNQMLTNAKWIVAKARWIDTLESESLSDDPTENTEVGVLNKINAATVISVRNTQDTTKLLAAVLDHQMVEAKERRDAQVQSINCDVALRQQAPAAAAGPDGGAGRRRL